jgi:serine/threonine protein kinase/alpha-tubulin suppressor-like RCC1 family protein
MMDAFDDSEVADLEDEYELLGELGRGASAIVYRARDRALGRLVAIKVVRAHSIASADDAMLRLAREARTVAKLQHPNIVTVHAVKRLQTGGLALVMQLVPGRTLKQAIVEHGPFAPEQAERVLHDVAEALAYAHAHGVVHRDVKPENIFLDADSGRALLSDFGIAHSADNESRLTMTGAAIGTPAYMAPEQIDGAPADARSDIYSLGLVMWEMLTGKRPWDGESLFNVISKQKQEDLPAIDALRPGVVPPRLQYITERMLQKRAAARWAGADGLLANLDHWVVPNDWRQWEAAHKRRREAARALRAEQREANEASSPSDMATIRFRRDGSTPGSNVQVIDRGALATPAAAAAALVAEDDKPSWAVETAAPPRRAWRAVMAGALLFAVGTGAAWYADATGRLDVRGLFGGSASGRATLVANADGGNQSGTERVTDTQAGTLIDSTNITSVLASDSVLSNGAENSVAAGANASGTTPALNGATPPVSSDRQASTAVPIVPPESVAPPVRRTAPVAVALPVVVAESSPAAPSVRATDDAGVVSAGGRHSCALSSGRALCWGANDAGQLGNGDVESRDAPSAVAGDLEFVQIAAGLAHTCGVARGGDAYCWGADDRGQLGDATTTSRSAPVRVNSNLNFRVVRSGSNHTCGLTTGAQIACWGYNNMGQLGDGTYGMRTSPVRVNTDQRFVSVSTGWNHSCAIAYDGSAWCWGSNNDGQLGDGSRTNQNSPQRVQSSLRFTSLSAGGGHTCGVTEDGALYCWGRNAFGQLGIGNTTSQTSPTRVESAARFTSVSVGGVHSCARTSSGQGWCWGLNTYGQLGDGSMVNRSSPVRVVGVSNFAVINATGAHTCGTTTDGSVSCWGFNVQGQLGDGTRNHLARPTRVAIPGR